MRRNQAGATAVEYVLLVALIALVVIATTSRIGHKVSNRIEEPATTLEPVPTAPPAPLASTTSSSTSTTVEP